MNPLLRRPRLLPLLAALTLGGALLAVPAARGQEPAAGNLADLSLDSLLDMPVTGASRFVQRRSQTSSAVRVITREEIRALGHRTLGEVLRSVTGAAISTDLTYDYLGVRGFLAGGDYSTRVLLLVDGNRINDPLYDQAFLGGEFPLDLDAVERVEFVPGQGSAVYGANALFGVVNVITREAPRSRQAELATGAASGGERALRAVLRMPWGDGGLQVMASRQVRQGYAIFDPGQVGVDGSDGWATGVDFTRRSAAYLRLDQGGFTASLLHADRVRATPAAVDLIFGDPRSRYRDTYSLLNVERSFYLGSDGQLTARAFAGRYRFTGDFVVDYPPPTLNHDDSVASWRGLEARYRVVRGAHRLVTGFELQDEPTLRQRNVDIEPEPATYVDDDRRAWRTAAYVEDQWSLATDWELHLGLRADRAQGLAWQASPRAALLWSPDPAWALKLIHGRAFRPPNAYEAHYAVDGPAGYRVNPALAPERVVGTEFVAEWRPLAAWRLSGSLYRNRASRLILLSYDEADDRYQYDNLADLEARGGELEAEYALDGVRWRLGASWVHNRGSGAELSHYPARMLKGTAIWPLWADWTLALEAQALSRRGEAPGQGVVHLTVDGTTWQGGPALTLGVRNLADRALYEPGIDPERQPVIAMPGREWRIEARWPLSF